MFLPTLHGKKNNNMTSLKASEPTIGSIWGVDTVTTKEATSKARHRKKCCGKASKHLWESEVIQWLTYAIKRYVSHEWKHATCRNYFMINLAYDHQTRVQRTEPTRNGRAWHKLIMHHSENGTSLTPCSWSKSDWAWSKMGDAPVHDYVCVCLFFRQMF